MRLGRLIREWRSRRGLKVQELAEKLGTTPGYVSKLEVRGEIPTPEMICRLAEVLGVEPEELVNAAKKEKVEQLSQGVDRKYDEALALYRKSR